MHATIQNLCSMQMIVQDPHAQGPTGQRGCCSDCPMQVIVSWFDGGPQPRVCVVTLCSYPPSRC